MPGSSPTVVGIGLVKVSWPRKEVPRDDLTEPIVLFQTPNNRVAVIILLPEAARASGPQLTEGRRRG